MTPQSVETVRRVLEARMEVLADEAAKWSELDEAGNETSTLADEALQELSEVEQALQEVLNNA